MLVLVFGRNVVHKVTRPSATGGLRRILDGNGNKVQPQWDLYQATVNPTQLVSAIVTKGAAHKEVLESVGDISANDPIFDRKEKKGGCKASVNNMECCTLREDTNKCIPAIGVVYVVGVDGLQEVYNNIMNWL